MIRRRCMWIKIYRTRENRRYCESRGIRLSGPPLGRPRTITEATAEQVQHDKHQAYDDAIARIAIEGKFGQGKRRFGLGRLMAKLALTSETMIQISFLVMNLEHLLSEWCVFLACCLVAGLAIREESSVGGPGERNA